MEGRLSAWLTERKIRTTITNETVEQRTGTAKERGYLFGVWLFHPQQVIPALTHFFLENETFKVV